jgi:hypothetical protein
VKQILHIFAKDVRRFWPEILVSLGLLAVLVLVCSRLWSLPQSTHWLRDEIARQADKLRLLTKVLGAFILVSWWLLITRVIHAEAPTGKAHFWITRPYDRRLLVAAKLFFLVVFLYVPLILAQMLMLTAAGLNPLASIAGMLFNLMLITGFYVLPLTAIATVTSTFFRTTLTLFCVMAVITPFAVKDIFNPGSPMDGSLHSFLYGGLPFSHLLPVGDQISLSLLSIAVCGVAIVLQYIFRRSWFARIALLAAPVIVCIGVVAESPRPELSDRAERTLHYPLLSADAAGPLQLADGRDEQHPVVVYGFGPYADSVWVRLPLLRSPLREGTAATQEGLDVTITNASGFSWRTTAPVWYPERVPSDGSYAFGSGSAQRRQSQFTIPIAIYDKFKSAPVTVHLTLARGELQVAGVTRIPFPIHEVSVPGVGVCRAGTLGYGIIQCRSAFRQPQLTYVSADWSQSPCPAPQTEMKEVRGETWMGFSDSEPADLGIVPVQYSWGAFMSDHNNTTGGSHLCTGTPITFTQYKMVRRTLTNLTLQNVRLSE